MNLISKNKEKYIHDINFKLLYILIYILFKYNYTNS